MPWEPLPHEAGLFSEIYIDESSQNNHHYLLVGGIIVSRNRVDWLENEIISARGQDLPIRRETGEIRCLKWEKVKNHNYRAYMRVVDHFVTLGGKLPTPLHENFVEFHSVAADLHRRNTAKYSFGDEDVAFSKELSFLCVHRFGRRFYRNLFHVYPDRRSTKITEKLAQDILNFSIVKRGIAYKREWPFRRFKFKEPEEYQALQLVDVLIGAIAYRLNKQHERPNANKGKSVASEHIWNRLRLRAPGQNSWSGRPFTLFYRKYDAK